MIYEHTIERGVVRRQREWESCILHPAFRRHVTMNTASVEMCPQQLVHLRGQPHTRHDEYWRNWNTAPHTG